MSTSGGAGTLLSQSTIDTYSVLGAPASLIGSELPWLTGSGPSLCPTPKHADAIRYLGTPQGLQALSLSNGHQLRVVAGLVKDVCDASVVLIEGHYVPTLPGGSSAGDVV